MLQWKKSAEPGAISQTTRSHLASANETRSRSAHISLRPAPNSPQPVSKQRLHRPDSLLHAATAATVCAVLYVCARCVCVGVWVGGGGTSVAEAQVASATPRRPVRRLPV